MEDHKRILKSVGTVLLVVGILDISYMAYCIANKISYSSSFNIFSVIAGILLLRQSLKTARVVAWFSAFMLVGFVGVILMFAFIEPWDLKIIRFTLDPLSVSAMYLFSVLILALVFWVYRSLRSEPVLMAQEQAGIKTDTPKLAYALGGLLVVGLSYAMYTSNYGESGLLAKEKAKEIHGEDYSYYVNGMNWAGNHVSARLLAFNSSEIIPVEVRWVNETANQ